MLVPVGFTLVVFLAVAAFIQSKRLEEANAENRCDRAYVPYLERESGNFSYHCNSFDAEFTSCMAYLRENIPSFDVINADTLGFTMMKSIDDLTEKSRNYADIDGLNQGVVNVGINNSLTAKIQYPWASKLSKAVFYEFVLPYAVVSACSS